MRYDDAVASLFQGPLEQFVAERKRLAGELKAAGDKAAAAKLAKLPRPPISAWVIDQLWWYARPAFEALFETAQRLRDGELEATPAHRDAIAKLRAEAAKLLTDAEHGATEATLHRVTQTLAALAAAGGWEPDLPGALSADRDPPGFEAIGIRNLVELPATPTGKPEPKPAATNTGGRAAPERSNAAGAHGADQAAQPRRDDARAGSTDHPAREHRDASKPRDDEHGTTEAAEATDELGQRREAAEAARRREMASAAARAEAAAELRRAEAERAKAAAERQRLEAALRTARGDVAQREREVARLEHELALARNTVAQARAVVDGLEERLAQLDN